MNPLNSVPAAIVSGVVLAIIVFVIMWVGLLFYVNVAQFPGLTAAADKGGPGGAGITSTWRRGCCCGSAGRLSRRG